MSDVARTSDPCATCGDDTCSGYHAELRPSKTVDNPWREFIENVISGKNYFRTSEYRELIADLDRLYALEEKHATQTAVVHMGIDDQPHDGRRIDCVKCHSDETNEPSMGLLVSMAIRMDHGLGVPGYYDQPMFGNSGPTHQQRLDAAITTARQMWEEATGHGFYRPEKEAEYAARASLKANEPS